MIEFGTERGECFYALHEPGGGLKAGLHHSGLPADPDGEREPDPTVVELVSGWVAARFIGIDPEPPRVDTCFYTCTEDERFVLERRGRVVVGSACSGHAFKFAPAVGERLAALARR